MIWFDIISVWSWSPWAFWYFRLPSFLNLYFARMHSVAFLSLSQNTQSAVLLIVIKQAPKSMNCIHKWVGELRNVMVAHRILSLDIQELTLPRVDSLEAITLQTNTYRYIFSIHECLEVSLTIWYRMNYMLISRHISVFFSTRRLGYSPAFGLEFKLLQ